MIFDKYGRNLFKTLELVCIALRWARLNGRFWACCRIQGRIIPHSRTSFCPCELMQSLSKSCLEMLHDRNGLIAYSKWYIFVWSFLITGVSACTCLWHKYHTFYQKLPLQLQSQQGQCVSSFASSELLLLSPHVGPADFWVRKFHAFAPQLL